MVCRAVGIAEFTHENKF